LTVTLAKCFRKASLSQLVRRISNWHNARMNKQPDTQIKRERLTKLFEFLKAYSDLRYPPVRDINQQPRIFWLKDLPVHPSVELFRDTAKIDDETDDSDVALRLTRPIITTCPAPPPSLSEWVKPSWRDFPGKIEVENSRNIIGSDEKTRLERFEDDDQRRTHLQNWQRQREQWVTNERPARHTLTFFQTVYEWYGILQREGEKIELMVGDGLLCCPDAVGKFRHPVLLQKLELEFYPEKKQPQFVFRKREKPPELYMEFLRVLPEVNNQQLARCADELKKTEFAPLGEDDTDGFLRRLIQGLFPARGAVREGTDQLDLKAQTDSPTIERQPVIFMRQRRTGPSSIFDAVLQDIASRLDFSPALLQILGLAESAPNQTESISGGLGLGNEDEDVLLSKPANREQLEIAKQLARRDCVLVQGPPGTGKTHTIANLLGHLLAQGKRVLVTAHTPKALRVLRQKVVEALQPLCISVLHNDKQSQEDLQSSVRTIHLRLAEDDRLLEREAQRSRDERKRILKALCDARGKFLDARQDEIRDVVFAGKSTRPIEAAMRVKERAGKDDWIPSPVTLGESLPVSHADVVALYQTNARISAADERELVGFRPELTALPSPKEFLGVVEELNSLAGCDLRFREELWNSTLEPEDLKEFDRMLETARKTIEFLRDSAPWQLEAIQAGRDGDEARRVWLSLSELIEKTWREVQECHALVVQHGPGISDNRPPHELILVVEEIIQHSEAGNSFGLLTKLTKKHWFEFRQKVQVGSRALDLNNSTHLRAVRALLRMRQLRSELTERWERQMACQGGPACSELGEHPERVCKQFVGKIQTCLEWHNSTWHPLESEFERLGFLWPVFLESTQPETGTNAELNRIRSAVMGDLGAILGSRSGWLRHKQLKSVLAAWPRLVPTSETPDALVTQNLRRSLREISPANYQEAYEELARLKNLELDLARRRALLKQISRSAPAWASAVENRHPKHNRPEPPGEPESAWEWRQLHDELERRANVSLDQLQRQIEVLGHQLLDVTAQLVEKQTWMKQIRQTGSEQKQALGAFAAMKNKLTKTGKGVKDAELRAAARREMTTAKDAVPVWIMPLAEVADTFDPGKARFDVVIIDEASQCDPTSLFALYLGQQTIVVGDDEQVTPVAVGVQAEEVMKLIRIFLDGVPHKELYDGETSVYELAQINFGGVIRLTEHFRCAPDIIAFSNNLSYKGEIKPLREASSIPLNPHVVHYRVQGGRDRGDNVNEVEAETIAALICAATEQPEYAKNDEGKPVSFGVVSLVADKQALKIDGILRHRLEPAEYQRRQILCGDSAQFQGDERDVMFLSVVDSPPSEPPLTMRQEGGKKIFKKRFNVAASRARNQMWIVHSLNHETDLQPGDYRRRLIEHAHDPNAWERELRKSIKLTESIFEERVLRRLMEAHYNVIPQFHVGAYRIDLVVIGNGRRLAVECDGERWHGPEKLQEDAERQAILERLGWKFVRIRGSLFFRDEDRALSAMFGRLAELNITPELELAASKPSTKAEVVERVIRRAQELRAEWRSKEKIEETPSPKQWSDTRIFHPAHFPAQKTSVSTSHNSPVSIAAQPTRPVRSEQVDLKIESKTEIGLTPVEIRDTLFRFIPAEGKIKREELLQKISEHWGIPIKKARSVLNRAIADERRAGRLRLDDGWEDVWRD
jgi:very-short-patch-repair endonuclease